MDTKLLYQLDSYQTHCTSTIIGIDEESRSLILDQTVFYPGGGGQPCDTGTINIDGRSLQVVKVKKSPSGVLHMIADGVEMPAVGSVVETQIDWGHRYQLMRTHTAMHILCGVVFRDYGAQVTGGDMEPLKGRMDFEFETLQKELIGVIENAVNVEIQKNHPIEVSILPREEAFQIPDLIRTKINLLPEGIREVRIVNIKGLDLQADGGTHVKSTSEVGKMKIVDYKSKGKINKRIYVEVQ